MCQESCCSNILYNIDKQADATRVQVQLDLLNLYIWIQILD